MYTFTENGLEDEYIGIRWIGGRRITGHRDKRWTNSVIRDKKCRRRCVLVPGSITCHACSYAYRHQTIPIWHDVHEIGCTRTAKPALSPIFNCDVQPAAPALWAHETTSVIAKAVHFGEIIEKEAHQALEKLDSLGLHLFVADAEQNRAAFDWTKRLKSASAYDSYYLVLAKILECYFWTADKRLLNALQDAHLGWIYWIEELTP